MFQNGETPPLGGLIIFNKAKKSGKAGAAPGTRGGAGVPRFFWAGSIRAEGFGAREQESKAKKVLAFSLRMC